MIVYLINRLGRDINFKISSYDKVTQYIPKNGYIKLTENSSIKGVIDNYNKLSTKLVIRSDIHRPPIKSLAPNDLSGVKEYSDEVLYHYDDAFTLADAQKFGDQLANEMRRLGL